MKREFPRDILIEALENMGMDEDNIRPRYPYTSDQTCPGVVLADHYEMRRFAFELGRLIDGEPEEFTEVAEAIVEGRTDSMAHGIILFWPALTLTG